MLKDTPSPIKRVILVALPLCVRTRSHLQALSGHFFWNHLNKVVTAA